MPLQQGLPSEFKPTIMTNELPHIHMNATDVRLETGPVLKRLVTLLAIQRTLFVGMHDLHVEGEGGFRVADVAADLAFQSRK